MIFCYKKYQENYMVFNKKVSKDRWREVNVVISNIFGDDFKLKLNENTWSDEWKKLTSDQWRRILEIPEADKKVIENIVGFELRLNDEVEIVVEGKSKWISRKSAEALNLI